MLISRRRFLSSTALAGAGAALGACSLTKTPTGYSVTVNVAEADAWAQAFKNAATLVLAIPAFTSVASAAVIAGIDTAVGLVATDIGVIDKAASGQVTITLQTTGVKDALSSLLTAGNQIISLAQGVVPTITDSTEAQTVTQYLAAASTLASVLSALLASASVSLATSAVKPDVVTQRAAYRTLRVVAPANL